MTNKNRKRGGKGKKAPASAADVPEGCLIVSLSCQGPVVNLPEAVGTVLESQPAAANTEQSDTAPARPSGTEIHLASWAQLGPLLTWFKQQLAVDGSAALTFSPALPNDLRAHVHNSVSGMKGLATVSEGVGEERAVSVVAQGAAPRTLIPAAVKDAGVALWRLAQEAGWGGRYSRDEVVAMMGGGRLPEELQQLWEGPLGRQQVLLHQLCTAASCGEVSQVQQLLAAHPGLLQGNVQDLSSGALPLHLAAAGGCEEVVRLLLGAGADVHGVDSCGRTALQVAQAAEECTVEALLLQAGAVNTQQDTWRGLMAPAAAAAAADGGGDSSIKAAAPASPGAPDRGASAAAVPAGGRAANGPQQQQQIELSAEEVLAVDNSSPGDPEQQLEEEEQEEGEEEDPELAAALEGLLTVTRLTPTTTAAAAAGPSGSTQPAASSSNGAAGTASSTPATTAGAGAGAAGTSSALQPASSSSGSAGADPTSSKSGAGASGQGQQQQEVLGEELLCEDHSVGEGMTWGAAEEEEDGEEGGADDPAAAAALEGLLTVRRLVPVAAAPETAAAPAATAALGAAAAAPAAALETAPGAAAAAAGGGGGPSTGQPATPAASSAAESSSGRGAAVQPATATESDARTHTGADTASSSSSNPVQEMLQQVAQQVHPLAQQLQRAASNTWSNTCTAAVDGWSNATSWVQEQLPPNVKQQLQQLAGGPGQGEGQQGNTLPPAVVWGGVAMAGALAVGGIIALSTGSRRRRARRR